MPGWWLVAAGALAVAAGAVLPAVRIRGRKRAVEGAQAHARTLNERLGYCVETLHAGDDRITEQLLADATERWHTAGGLLARARVPGEFTVAEEVAGEGLRYVGQACRRLDVPVPDLPELPELRP